MDKLSKSKIMIMRNHYLHTLFMLAFCINAGAQTIAFQGFEGAIVNEWQISSGATLISNNPGSGDAPADSRIRTGDYSWQVNQDTGTLELAPAMIMGKTGVKVIIRLSSTSKNMNQGADPKDKVMVFLNVDGAGFPVTPDVTLKGNSNAKWDYDATLTAFTMAGNPLEVSAPQGGLSNNNYAAIEVSVPDDASSVALRIIASNNAVREVWNIDDIELIAASTEVFFNSTTATVLEGAGTYNLDVSILGADPDNATTAVVALISGAVADLGDYMPQMVTFSAGSSADQTVTLTLTDDALFEADQTYTLQIQNVSGGNEAAAGVNDEFVLTVYDDETPNIVINEICGKPDLDTNGDGVVEQREDEFVELVNISGETVDISGWTISDRTKVRHVFPDPTVLGPDIGIVVFGGGTPTGIPSLVNTASTTNLQLTNGGDDVIFARPSGVVVDAYTFEAWGSNRSSLARNPDFTGPFMKHSEILTNPVPFSPGAQNVDAVALPIELGPFWAEQKGNQVLLRWEPNQSKTTTIWS